MGDLRTRTATKIVDPTTDANAVSVSAAGNLAVEVALALPTGANTIGTVNTTAQETDDVAIAVGGALVPIGFAFDDVSPVVVEEGDAGYARMSANRNIYTTLRDAAGAERGANITAANELNVIATAQPGVDLGDVDVLSVIPGVGATNLGKAEDAASANGDVGVAVMTIQDAVLSALPGSIDGDYTQLRVNANGALWVETVGAQGGTSAVDDALFTTGTDSYTPVGGILDETTPNNLEENDGGIVRMTANRAFHTVLRDGAGNERSVNVTASNELNVIASAQPGVDIGDVDILSLPTSPDTKAEDAIFAAASKVFPMGAQFDDAAINAMDEDDIGAPRMSANRNLYGTIRDAAGAERGVNVTAANELNVLASAQPGVDIGDVTILDFAAALTDADDDIVASAQTSLRIINLNYGFDGTQWERIQTDAGGAMDVNVVAGGGESLPTSPVRTTGNSTNTAAGSAFTQDGPSADGTTTKVRGFDCSASVPIKVELQTAADGVGTTVLTQFARAGEPLIFRSPHRNFYSQAHPSNAGFDGWRIVSTNLDNSEAADLYVTLYTED